MDIGESRHVNVLLLISLCLCVVSVLIITHNKSLFRDSKYYFLSPMSTNEKQEMLQLLRDFRDILDSNRIKYFIDGGTLIGSVRHHGPVPWDDDIDILIDSSYKTQLSKAVAQLNPTYILFNESDLLAPYGQWKFFKHNSSRSFIHRPFRWPYIDIWFYYMNSTHVINEKKPYLVLKKIDVFPLTVRPFGGLQISSVCNASAILESFNIEMCITRSYSHIFEVPVSYWWQRVIRCSELYAEMPFVFIQTQSGVKPYFDRGSEIGNQQEILRIGNRVISNVTVFQSKCVGL